MTDNPQQEGNSNPDESPDENATEKSSETDQSSKIEAKVGLWPWSKSQPMTVEEYRNLKKSLVRPRVTYILLMAYIVFSVFLIMWLMFGEETVINSDGSATITNIVSANKETILVVFASFSTLVTSIVSYWFGSRGNKNTTSDT